jgi:hypothetical protein
LISEPASPVMTSATERQRIAARSIAEFEASRTLAVHAT